MYWLGIIAAIASIIGLIMTFFQIRQSSDEKALSLVVSALKGMKNLSNLGISVTDEQGDHDDEIQLSRRWCGKAMDGTWDGEGIWHLEDKTWIGNGCWRGGMLFGTWTAKGTWLLGRDSSGDWGDWCGEGEFNCNMEFMNHMGHTLIITGLIISILTSISCYYIVDFNLDIAVIAFLLLVGLTVLIIRATRSTTKGRAKLSGTWKDIGDFRILDITGYARLGYHSGVFSGKMKDRIHNNLVKKG